MNHDCNRLITVCQSFRWVGADDFRLGEAHGKKSALGLQPHNRFKPQEPLVDVQAVVELAASFGPVAINRAYCNWQFFGRYRDALLQSAVELIQLFPPGGGAKNGADIKLCLDATEDIGRFGHLGTIIIVGGDSDFMPVAQKIKAAGLTLVGIGTRKNTNKHWAKSCHEFRFYDTLVDSEPAPAPAQDQAPEKEAPPPPADPVADLLRRAVRLLAEAKGESWVHKASIWPMMKRLDSTIDLKSHGFEGFSEMLKAKEPIVEVKKGDTDHMVRLK